jgi:hypothetical protein
VLLRVRNKVQADAAKQVSEAVVCCIQHQELVSGTALVHEILPTVPELVPLSVAVRIFDLMQLRKNSGYLIQMNIKEHESRREA